MAPPPSDDDVSAGSILRELIFNQYQAIVLGGTALLSLIALNPVPLLVWLGSELVLLPILDSGPLRRLVNKRKRELAKAAAEAGRARTIAELEPMHVKRYAALEDLCRQIEANYQSLTGISQAYLAEQRGKLDVILNGSLHRLIALQRYQRMPARRSAAAVEEEIERLEKERARPDTAPRTAAALEKTLELKRRLLASIGQVGDTVRTLQAEIESMESLLEVLHQNSLSLRDPQAISNELDTIVRQSEESERVVREMESLLRADVGAWDGDAAVAVPPIPTAESSPPAAPRNRTRQR